MLSPIIPVHLRVLFRTRPRWPSISKHDRGGYDGLCVPDLPLGLLPLLSSLVKPLLLTLYRIGSDAFLASFAFTTSALLRLVIGLD